MTPYSWDGMEKVKAMPSLSVFIAITALYPSLLSTSLSITEPTAFTTVLLSNILSVHIQLYYSSHVKKVTKKCNF